MLSRPSSLIDLIRQSDSLRRISRYLPVIAPVLGIQESSCLTIRPSGLSPLNFPELPPSTSAGSPTRALPRFTSVSALAIELTGKNSWRFQYPATNSTQGYTSTVRPFALATALLFARLLCWSDLNPSVRPSEPFTSGLPVTGSPHVTAGYNYDATLGLTSTGLSPASSTAILAASPLGLSPQAYPPLRYLLYSERGDAQKGGSVLVSSSLLGVHASSIVATKSPPLPSGSVCAACFLVPGVLFELHAFSLHE